MLPVSLPEPKIPFKRKLVDVEVKEKETATLQCEVPMTNTQASWYMEETRIEQNAKYRMDQEGTLRRLTIHNVTTNDDAVYICEMKEGSRTVAELTVLGKTHGCLQWKVKNVVLSKELFLTCLHYSREHH